LSRLGCVIVREAWHYHVGGTDAGIREAPRTAEELRRAYYQATFRYRRARLRLMSSCFPAGADIEHVERLQAAFAVAKRAYFECVVAAGENLGSPPPQNVEPG
jgi:hypothetical protein